MQPNVDGSDQCDPVLNLLNYLYYLLVKKIICILNVLYCYVLLFESIEIILRLVLFMVEIFEMCWDMRLAVCANGLNILVHAICDGKAM